MIEKLLLWVAFFYLNIPSISVYNIGIKKE